MKNIGLFYFLCLLAMGSSACLDDSGELVDIANSEAATLTVNPGGTVIKNITNEISFPVDFTAKWDPDLVNSIDILLNFEGVNNTVSNQIVTSLTTLPADISFSMDELLSQSGLTIAELNAGDSWTYSYSLNNNAGSSWKVLRETRFTFTCPSDLAGSYAAVTSATSTDDCCTEPITDFTATVALTEVRPGVYQINDYTAGIYFEWYDIYGVSGPDDNPGRLEHICDKVNVIETTEFFGTSVTGGGAYDESTGVITYSWTNGYGDTGTVTLTPL